MNFQQLSRCLAIGVVLACCSWTSAEERPNVLLILVDDLKPAIGCYGDTHAKTPSIDALAARGMRFDMAYCNQAVCAPSRFTLMLGSHSTSTGLYSLGSRLRNIIPDAVTMPQYFAEHGGYRTESLGKVFHIGHGNEGDPDSFSVPHFKEKVIEYVDPASTPGGQLTREEAYFSNQRLGEIGSLPRGAAYESPDVADESYADGRVAIETVKRLEEAKQRREADGTPFFIAAGFARPHLPFSAPKKYWDLYDPSELPLPEFEELPAGSPSVAGKRGGEIRNYFPVPDKSDQEQIDAELKCKLIHGYYASTSFVDAQIGKVIAGLDRLGLADNTIIVLWGDHGFHLGDLGIWTKHTNYEQANRIPILITAPGVTTPGSSTGQLTESVDIYPTLAELAGLPKPNGPQPIDGVSLVPVLRDPNARVRDHAYHAYPKNKLGRAIRTPRYRFVEWKKIGEPDDTAEYELYDYQTDPLETRNHAEDHSEIIKQLQAILASYPAAVDQTGNRERIKTQSPTTAIQTPQIDNRPITVTGKVTTVSDNGVIVAQGGRVHGFAVHLVKRHLAWDVRVDGQVRRLVSEDQVPDRFEFTATLQSKTMTLSINGQQVASGSSPGLIPVQPQDGLDIGFDNLSAAGDYTSPNPLDATITNIDVKTGPVANQTETSSTTPFQSELITPWGAEVTAENAWSEYPRPQLRRDQWINLNGHWDYAVTPIEQQTIPTKWTGKILVPFCLESKLGGVQRLLDAHEALCYHRTFAATKSNCRQLLNFDAVDYRCEVFVNGTSVGQHTGGNTPFSFDISQAVRDGENELVVRVEDATEAFQLRGKQVLNAKGVWYTQVSGIWQTVWLEEVASDHISHLKITTDADTETITVKPTIQGTGTIQVAVKDGENTVAIATGDDEISLKIPDAKLWSPPSPHLYDIEVTLVDASGATLDEVKSYTGIRTGAN